MKTGFYIPCFNAQKHIDGVINAVLAQMVKPADILIIDDASWDKTADIAGKYPVRVIRHKVNKGLAAARNTALANMDTEYIASVDADCLPDENWLKLLLNSFNSENIVGAGGRLKETYDKTACDQWRTAHMPQYWPDTKEDPEFLFGSNAVFRRKALLEIGGYDESLRNNYEDVDICQRLKAKGGRIVYVRQAVTCHLKKDTISSLLDTFWKWRLPYYKRQYFYETKEKFMLKMKDNIGLANRYLQEDINAGRGDIFYIDFLLAFDHCLRDFAWYIKQKDSGKSDFSLFSQWMSLTDLNFFYRYDRHKRALSTLLPKQHLITQNLFALLLMLGGTIADRFKSRDFTTAFWSDILHCLAQVQDAQLSRQLTRLIEKNADWSDFLIKEHACLKEEFLLPVHKEFNSWFNSLIHGQPQMLAEIRDSAEKLHIEAKEKGDA